MRAVPTLEATTEELAGVMRRAHVEQLSLALRARAPSRAQAAGALPTTTRSMAAPTDDSAGAGPPRPLRVRASARSVAVVDARNELARVDAGWTLAETGRRLADAGALLPVARPLPASSWAVACAAAPFLVDAWVHSAQGVTCAGDAWDTPRAPRAAAGPSLLGALTCRPPLAVATALSIRVAPIGRAMVERLECADVLQAARRVAELLDAGRAFSVDALGSVVLVLQTPSASEGPSPSARAAFAHRGAGRSGAFNGSVSLTPGDVRAMAEALHAGARVVAAPFMGRVGALVQSQVVVPIVETEQAARSMVAALAAGAHGGAS